MKEHLKKILHFIKKILLLNNRYKLKLVFMLVIIFIIFSSIILYIINSRELDPLVLELDKTKLLGKIASSNLFTWGSHALFGRFDFGSSYETLLFLIIITFVILITMILLSCYIKLFLLPLTMVSGAIFYSSYKTIKNNYYIINTEEEEIFKNWGIMLKKNYIIIEQNDVIIEKNDVVVEKTITDDLLVNNINLIDNNVIDHRKNFFFDYELFKEEDEVKAKKVAELLQAFRKGAKQTDNISYPIRVFGRSIFETGSTSESLNNTFIAYLEKENKEEEIDSAEEKLDVEKANNSSFTNWFFELNTMQQTCCVLGCIAGCVGVYHCISNESNTSNTTTGINNLPPLSTINPNPIPDITTTTSELGKKVTTVIIESKS